MTRSDPGSRAPARLQARHLPYPTRALASRVGAIDSDDFYGVYDVIGRRLRDDIIALLPSDWSWDGKRVLDFGCGAGRVLRHFVGVGHDARLCGSDIDEESVRWLRANASALVEVVQNGEWPPLPWQDESFDLIWAISVFTHLTDAWSAWLLELHRLLRPDGILLASFMGSGGSVEFANEAWDETRIGMNVLRKHQSWDLGGPFVLHSPWWIEEHWGRAFEIEELWDAGFGRPDARDQGQGVVQMRKKPGRFTPVELEAIRSNDPREIRALQHNIRQLQREAERAATATSAQIAAAVARRSTGVSSGIWRWIRRVYAWLSHRGLSR